MILVLPWHYAYDENYGDIRLSMDTDMASMEGSQLEILKAIDEQMHAYAGIMDEAWLQKYQEDGRKSIQWTADDLADEYNKNLYGENWKAFCQRAAAGELTEQEMKQYVDSGNYHYVQEENHYYFKVYPKDLSCWVVANSVYQMNQYALNDLYYFAEDHIAPVSYETESQAMLTRLANHQVFATELIDDKTKNWEIAEIMEKAQGPYYFDSTYPNDRLERAITNSFNFFTLLMLAYIFSAMFSAEHQSKMNQLILSSKNASSIYTAKLLTGLLIAIALSVISIAGIFLMSYLFLPVRDFGLKGVVSWLNSYQTHYLFSYGTTILLEIVTIIMDYCFVVFLTMGLSYWTKNNLMTFASMLMIIVLPLFYSDPYRMHMLFRFMPGETIAGTNVAKNMTDLFAAGNRLWFIIPLVWMIYIFICIGISYGIYNQVKKHLI